MADSAASRLHGADTLDTEFTRGLGLYDATMVVVGSMIGSGIFIVSADMARLVGSPGWLLLAWVVTGVLTITAALSYGELAAMMPRAGGQYVYLREAFSPLWGFLYGWTLFMVIQTGTIAAVAVAFARFLGLMVRQHLRRPLPRRADPPLVGLRRVALHGPVRRHPAHRAADVDQHARASSTAGSSRTSSPRPRPGRCLALIVIGVLLGWNSGAVSANFGDLWTPRGQVDIVPGLTALTAFGLFVALCVAQTGSLFSSDAWNNITFTAGEVKDPRRNIPLSLALGTTIVIGLYLLANVAYLVTLPLADIQHAPADRVATATLDVDLPGPGRGDHGHRDHDLDLRLQQRPDPGRRACLLRDGARRAVLREGAAGSTRRRCRRGAWSSRASGRRRSCCRAPSTPRRRPTATSTRTCSTT